MWPRIAIEPRSNAAWIALTIFLIASVVSGMVSHRHRLTILGKMALFLTFLLGGMAGGVALHNAFGHVSLEISSYAVALVSGSLVAWAVLVIRLPALGVPLRLVMTILIGALVFGVVGARAAHLLSEWNVLPAGTVGAY